MKTLLLIGYASLIALASCYASGEKEFKLLEDKSVIGDSPAALYAAIEFFKINDLKTVKLIFEAKHIATTRRTLLVEVLKREVVKGFDYSAVVLPSSARVLPPEVRVSFVLTSCLNDADTR